MLPDAIYDEGIVDWIDHPIEGKVTKPPLISWAAIRLHDDDPDLPFLMEIYPDLVKWNQWWFSQLDSSSLPQYHHPYSSGLDDSPLWDFPFPITSPDLSTYLVIQMKALAKIASLIDRPNEAQEWEKRAEELGTILVSELYNSDLKMFPARNNSEIILEQTPFNLLPIWIKGLPSDIHDELLLKLQKGNLFWTEHPLQTVANNSPNFNPNVMWRGPVWININFLFITALRDVGHDQLADQLTIATLELINNNQDISEYYHPITGLPPQDAAPCFSWSAALFIDLVINLEDQKIKVEE
jgi:hypothetical protein